MRDHDHQTRIGLYEPDAPCPDGPSNRPRTDRRPRADRRANPPKGVTTLPSPRGQRANSLLMESLEDRWLPSGFGLDALTAIAVPAAPQAPALVENIAPRQAQGAVDLRSLLDATTAGVAGLGAAVASIVPTSNNGLGLGLSNDAPPEATPSHDGSSTTTGMTLDVTGLVTPVRSLLDATTAGVAGLGAAVVAAAASPLGLTGGGGAGGTEIPATIVASATLDIPSIQPAGPGEVTSTVSVTSATPGGNIATVLTSVPTNPILSNPTQTQTPEPNGPAVVNVTPVTDNGGTPTATPMIPSNQPTGPGNVTSTVSVPSATPGGNPVAAPTSVPTNAGVNVTPATDHGAIATLPAGQGIPGSSGTPIVPVGGSTGGTTGSAIGFGVANEASLFSGASGSLISAGSEALPRIRPGRGPAPPLDPALFGKEILAPLELPPSTPETPAELMPSDLEGLERSLGQLLRGMGFDELGEELEAWLLQVGVRELLVVAGAMGVVCVLIRERLPRARQAGAGVQADRPLWCSQLPGRLYLPRSSRLGVSRLGSDAHGAAIP